MASPELSPCGAAIQVKTRTTIKAAARTRSPAKMADGCERVPAPLSRAIPDAAETASGTRPTAGTGERLRMPCARHSGKAGMKDTTVVWRSGRGPTQSCCCSSSAMAGGWVVGRSVAVLQVSGGDDSEGEPKVGQHFGLSPLLAADSGTGNYVTKLGTQVRYNYNEDSASCINRLYQLLRHSDNLAPYSSPPSSSVWPGRGPFAGSARQPEAPPRDDIIAVVFRRDRPTDRPAYSSVYNPDLSRAA